MKEADSFMSRHPIIIIVNVCMLNVIIILTVIIIIMPHTILTSHFAQVFIKLSI